jgi:nucleotide-binding universal stress UspA family protein
VDTVLTNEPAAAAVVDAAAQHKADLVVAGTRGLTGWKRVVLGSVASRIVRKAPCPVVTVHADDAERHRPVHTILVPTDFSGDAMRAAEAAAAILGQNNSERCLFLLHVYRYPMVVSFAGRPVLTASPDEVIVSAHSEMAALVDHFSRSGLRVHSLVVESSKPAQAIVDEARRIKADLIAMGTHGRSGLDRLLLGSTAERVLSSAPCPILTVARRDGGSWDDFADDEPAREQGPAAASGSAPKTTERATRGTEPEFAFSGASQTSVWA